MFVPDAQATVLSTSEKFSSIQYSFKQSKFTEIYDYVSNCKSEKFVPNEKARGDWWDQKNSAWWQEELLMIK